nr:type IV secretion system protein [uncultured Cupriavidus sp.]
MTNIMSVAFVRRMLVLIAALLLIHSGSVIAETQPSTDTSKQDAALAALVMPQPGSIGEAFSNFLNKFGDFTPNLITGATALSTTVRPEADKIAFGLAVITLTFAALRFAGTSDPTSAWTDLLETVLVIGVFAALYSGYTQFGPGIYNWFSQLSTKISGTNTTNPVIVLASIGGSFIDSFLKALSAASWYQILGVAFSGLLLAVAFTLCEIAALVYTFFISLGMIQVAIGIVIGPIAVALGFHDYSRRFFNSWLDFMIGGSMYIVVAAIMGKLVISSFAASISDINAVGTNSSASAAQAIGYALLMIFVAFEIPKIAGAIFGSGGGISGGGAMRVGLKAAGGLGKFFGGK